MAFRPLQDVQVSLGNLQEEMNRMFDRVWHAGVSTPPFDGQPWAPPVDLYEKPDRYVLLIEVAGVDVGKIDVTYLGNMLTVRGEKPRPGMVGEGDRALRAERRYGTFCRNVELPCEIDAERVSARSQGGVLEITIPKSQSAMPRNVKVSISEG